MCENGDLNKGLLNKILRSFDHFDRYELFLFMIEHFQHLAKWSTIYRRHYLVPVCDMLANRVFVKLRIIVISLGLHLVLTCKILCLVVSVILLVLGGVVPFNDFTLILPSAQYGFLLFVLEVTAQKIYLFILFHLVYFVLAEVLGESLSHLLGDHWVTLWSLFLVLYYCALQVYMRGSLMFAQLAW